jgi:hypothetical protein
MTDLSWQEAYTLGSVKIDDARGQLWEVVSTALPALWVAERLCERGLIVRVRERDGFHVFELTQAGRDIPMSDLSHGYFGGVAPALPDTASARENGG